MNSKQSTLLMGNGGKILIDTTNTYNGKSSLKKIKKLCCKNENKAKKSSPLQSLRVCSINKDEVKDVAIQTEIISDIEDFDIPLEHWKLIAEGKRKLLADVLEENEMLFKESSILEDVIQDTKQLASVVEVAIDEDCTPLKSSSTFCHKDLIKFQYLAEKQLSYLDKTPDERSDKFNDENTPLNKTKSHSHKKNTKQKSNEKLKKKSSEVFSLDKIYTDVKKKTCNLASQTDDKYISDVKVFGDMLSSENASPEYWQILANKRQEAIEETHQENKRLKSYILVLEEMQKEAKEFALILTDILEVPRKIY